MKYYKVLAVGFAAAFMVTCTINVSVTEARNKQQQAEIESLVCKIEVMSEQLEKLSFQVPYEVSQIPIYNVPLEPALQAHLWKKCEEYKMTQHYELMLAVMWKESNFKPDLISATQDYGLMQINKCNHEYLSKTFGITNFLDPYQSIDAGVYIMSSLLRRYDGNEHKALMAYNAGPTGARKMWSRGDYSSSYSRAVLEKKRYIYKNK